VTQYALPGDKKYQEQLYPSPHHLDESIGLKTYKDVIVHFTASSLDEDGIEIKPDSLSVTESARGYKVSFEPLPKSATQAEHFKKMHLAMLDKGHAGLALRGVEACMKTPAWNPMAGYPVNREDGLSEWIPCLPLGMPIANHRAVTLLHYPPIGGYRTANYLNNNTLRRWSQLLKCVGIDRPKLYHAIIDLNPIAAPGSGESEYENDYFPINLTSLFFDNDDEGLTYVRSMLELMLNPPHNEANPYTLPLLVCGSPEYDPQAPGWFSTRYKDQLPTDEKRTPRADVLQVGFITLNLKSHKPTPYMIANHMIAAGVKGSFSSDASVIPNIQKYEAQDLVAATFLSICTDAGQRGERIDLFKAKEEACRRWFGAADGSGAPNPAADGDRLTICALAQMDKCYDHKKHLPMYTYQEAVARCQQKGGPTYDPNFGCTPIPANDGLPSNDISPDLRPTGGDYLICRSRRVDEYSVWRVDLGREPLLQRLPGQKGAKFDHTHQLISIGNYVLDWGPAISQPWGSIYPYRLFQFDPNNEDPLSAKAFKMGVWAKEKFTRGRPDFGNPDGATKAYSSVEELLLIPLNTFVLNVIPTVGRGTYKLFNFDPLSDDPLQVPFATPIHGSFEGFQFGHELIPLGNYVLERLVDPKAPADEKGKYWLWSFDPMDETPLARPAIQKDRWDDIDENHQLIPIGEHVLDWDVTRGTYRLWQFDPRSSNPLTGPVASGQMPDEFDAQMTLTSIQTIRHIDPALQDKPGTIDFMRSRIKHVVYYMLENCSFDHVCGWLYEHGEDGINFVGHDGAFQGAKHDLFNVDPEAKDEKVYLKKFNYKGGKLDFLPVDPYHDMTDTMRQYFFDGRNYDRDGYAKKKKPSMGGFVWNNGIQKVMWTFTPEQLPVLNGLARAFAISDEWFCSMPGATDSQRAFALTGSSLGQLNNFMNSAQYTNWPSNPHRSSIWKVLWANGFTDWKIYNSVKWPMPKSPEDIPFVLTYHLFLEGQIQSLDKKQDNYSASLDQFKEDARAGTLPAFSFLEPVWIMTTGFATSYHPSAEDGKTPGEKALNEIYEALKTGPKWNETLLVITFDEHGGLFDHVPPPYAHKPWPHDENDGFKYDLMGVRVPTILVSPWIKEHTVFRSPKPLDYNLPTPVAYDSTSILATLLNWYGIPRARWGLGDRTHYAPTFEGVFQCQSPRTDAPALPSPPSGEALPSQDSSKRVRSLHQHVAWRMINYVACRKLKMSARAAAKLADDIFERATDFEDLRRLMEELIKQE
jgi:phospholipase C